MRLDNLFGNKSKINYVDPVIANTRYDIAKGGKQYEDAPEGLVWDANRNRYVRAGAPPGILGAILGFLDWQNMDTTDWDRAGKWGSKNKYGVEREAGTLGGQRVEIKPMVNNPNFNAAKARTLQLQQTGAVPEIDQTGRWINQFAQDAYSGWRDQRRMATNYGMVGNVLKDANLFGYGLDKAAMYDYMNSPRGQAETALKLQQGMAVPRFAKAALIEAIAKRQDAANEFGQLGTKRTYFTG